jgi:hypothetical protein
MSNRIIFPNYRPAWEYSNALGDTLANIGNWISGIMGNVGNASTAFAKKQETEQKRIDQEIAAERNRTMLIIAAMAVAAVVLVLIFRKK